MQDIHAAVRYMRAHAAELRIDPDKIYLLGNSAGGMMGLENIYADSVRQKAFAFLYKLAVGLIPSEGEHTTPMPFATIARASRIEMGENNLSFRVTRGQNVAYAVFGLKGERKLMGRASEGETVDLSGLESGVYYLRVQGDVARRIGIAK